MNLPKFLILRFLLHAQIAKNQYNIRGTEFIKAVGSCDGKLVGDQGSTAKHFAILGLDLDHPWMGAMSCRSTIDNSSLMNRFTTCQRFSRTGLALPAGIGTGGELDCGVGLGVVVLPGYELCLSLCDSKQMGEAFSNSCNEPVYISTGLQVFISGFSGNIIIDNNPIYC